MIFKAFLQFPPFTHFWGEISKKSRNAGAELFKKKRKPKGGWRENTKIFGEVIFPFLAITVTDNFHTQV